MKINSNSERAISKFVPLAKLRISSNPDDGTVSLFMFPVSSRQFNYDKVEDDLLESVLEYALSKSTRDKYQGNPMKLSRLARGKYKTSEKNKGELGELLLYCFMEGDLKAPKILSKLELKTSNEMYVNGSDGIHLYKTDESHYQLIFCESKMYQSLRTGLKAAFDSIFYFLNEINDKGTKSNRIKFEKGLISNNLDQCEINDLDETDIKVIESLIYPNTTLDDVKLEDAFGIFVGYQIDIEKEKTECSKAEFEEVIKGKIIEDIENLGTFIYDQIKGKKLIGYTFYVYLLPFTEIDITRKSMLEVLLR